MLGEVKLKVPPHWSVNIDAVAVLGDTEDKRDVVPGAAAGGPTLVITGLVLLGSLKITD